MHHPFTAPAWGIVRVAVGPCVVCGCATEWLDTSLDRRVCSEGCLGDHLDRIATPLDDDDDEPASPVTQVCIRRAPVAA